MRVNREASILFGKQRILSAPCPQNGTFAADPQGQREDGGHSLFARREGLGGRDGGDAGCPEEDGGGRDMDAC